MVGNVTGLREGPTRANTAPQAPPAYWGNSSAQFRQFCEQGSCANVPVLEALETNNLTLIMYGYVSPLLVALTIITNILVCVILLKRNMRNSTNCMLVAMALSDMLTGMWPIPCFVYFYTLEHWREWIPYNWCFTYYCLTDYLPTIFHTASIWLTVCLDIQRYLYVCKHSWAKDFCTIRNVIKSVAAAYIIATVTQTCRFLESEYFEVTLPSRLNPSVNVSVCASRFRKVVNDNVDLYFNVYFWFRVVFIHVLPCLMLVVLNAFLIAKIRRAQKRRKKLLRQNRRTEGKKFSRIHVDQLITSEANITFVITVSFAGKKLKEKNCTTIMLVAVVGVFLLVELPLGNVNICDLEIGIYNTMSVGIFLVLLILQNTNNIHIMDKDTMSTTSLVLNMFILLSYPVNFFIYCGMSKQFRKTFKALFLGGSGGRRDSKSNYTEAPTENHKDDVKTTKTMDVGDNLNKTSCENLPQAISGT